MDATQRITNGLLTMAMVAALIGCEATESHKRLDVEGVASRWSSYSGPKHKLAIGQFENKSPYMKGIFSDGKDRLGLQARQILKTHLSQTNRFVLLDRTNLKEIERETDFSGRERRITGGDVVLTGAVTEFGRRETGGQSLWGILGKSKKQVAYAKVSQSLLWIPPRHRCCTRLKGRANLTCPAPMCLGLGRKPVTTPRSTTRYSTSR